MTYGFRPENWPAFQSELQKRGIAVTDIEKVEMRPEVTPPLRSPLPWPLRVRSSRPC